MKGEGEQDREKEAERYTSSRLCFKKHDVPGISISVSVKENEVNLKLICLLDIDAVREVNPCRYDIMISTTDRKPWV